MKLHVHANGLQLSISESWEVSTTPVGFNVEPMEHSLRSPIDVSIQLLEVAPKSAGYRVRYLGSGRSLWYSVTHEEEGGSGGVDYTVIAFEHVGHRWIKYLQVRQAEWTPEFELWEVAEGVKYVPPK